MKVEVDVPTEAIQMQINTAGAAGNAVGGDRLDEVARTVTQVQDKLITVKTDLESKINMLGENKETIEIDSKIAVAVNNGIQIINREISDLRNQVGSTASDQRQYKSMIETRLTEMDYKISNTQNITGIGIGGGGLYNG